MPESTDILIQIRPVVSVADAGYGFALNLLPGNIPYTGYGTYGILIKNLWGPAALKIVGGTKNDAGNSGYTRTASVDFQDADSLRWGIGIHPTDDPNMGFKIWEAQAGDLIRFHIDAGGNICIGGVNATSKLQVIGLMEYADNATAITAGLTVGALYRTGDILKIVH